LHEIKIIIELELYIFAFQKENLILMTSTFPFRVCLTMLLTTVWWLWNFDMERFNLKKLIRLKYQVGLLLWTPYMKCWHQLGSGKLETISKLKPKRF
jgi:glucose dehydrogenase